MDTPTIVNAQTGRGNIEQATSGDVFQVLFFASASTFTGVDAITFAAPSTMRQVFAALEREYPGFTEMVLKSAAVTVNLEYVDVDLAALDAGKDLGVGDGNGGQDGTAEKNNGEDGIGAHGNKDEKLATVQGNKAETASTQQASASASGLDMVIKSGDEIGIIPPVSSG